MILCAGSFAVSGLIPSRLLLPAEILILVPELILGVFFDLPGKSPEIKGG